MGTSPTLVIMAAGAARRYGGLKQLAPVGPTGQALMEYSIYDAKRAGIAKVVLVVRREFEEMFCESFVDRARDSIDIVFAYQDANAFVPHAVEPPERIKPWGTAHAVLCAKAEVFGPFAVINADDFYGKTAIEAIGSYLTDLSDDSSAAVVGYELQNTLSDHGTVNRGVCQLDTSGVLTDIVERFEIQRTGGAATCRDAQGNTLPLSIDATVSMNLWGFHTAMLDHLAIGFAQFLETEPDVSVEYELPTFIKQQMDSGGLRVRVVPTHEKWCGMTYPDDLPAAQDRIARLVAEGVYPEQLW